MILSMLWFRNKHKHHTNYTPFKLKKKWNARVIAIRVFVVVLLLGWGGYAFFYAKNAEAAWRDSAWAFRKKITIDHTKVPNTDQTNFPILINIRDFDVKANAQASGNDIMFTSSDGTTKLDHEIEKYTNTTGELVAWVRIPTLSHTTDNVIYMYYGNSAAADQSNKTGVWDSNYKGVWHLSESSTSGQRLDSTGNANNLTNNASVTGGTGVVDGDNVFSGSNYLNRTNATQTGLSITGNITIEAWIKRSTFATNGVVGGKDGTSAGNSGYTLRTTTGAKAQMILGTAADGSVTNSTNSNTVLNTNQWYHVVGVYDGTNAMLYLNAAVDKTGAYSGGIFNSTGDVEIGSRNGGSVLYNGDIDEFRVSNTARSADWISTEYNNQNSPSTFYTVGAREQGTLTMYWKFDEGYGTTAHDSSVNGISGTLTSTTWTNEDLCIFGKCLSFNGSTSKVVGTYDDKLDVSTNPFSVDLWFKHPNTISATQYLLTRFSSGGYKIYMKSSGVVCFGIDDGATFTPKDEACSTASYADSTWHQVKVVKTSTPTIVIYVDGKQVGSDTSLTATTTLSGSSPTVNVGIDSDGSSNAWSGLIDEVKVYNGARTAAQIVTDANAKGSANGAGVTNGTFGSSLGNGLVGYWKMDESSWTQDCTTSTVADSSGNGSSGRSCPSTTGPTTTTSGKFGNAGNFDGSDDYVSVPSYTSLNGATAFTVSAWVNFTTSMTEKYIAWKLSQFDVRIGTNDMMMSVSTSAGGGNVRVFPTLAGSAWHHAVYKYDGANIYIFLDGNLVGSTPVTGTVSNGSNDLQLGAANAGANFSGQMDDVRIYKRGLSDSEVKTLYDWGPGPVARWKLDEGTGTTANDNSGNNLTGTLTTSPTWVAGKYGRAVDFSPTSSYISVADNAALNITGDITYEAWVKPTTIDGTARLIFGKGTASANTTRQYSLRLNTSNRWEAFAYTGSTANSVADTTVTPSTSRWDHIAAVRDTTAATLKIYINGVLTGTSTGVTGAINTTSDIFAIGREGTTASNYFGGQVDDVRIYNYIRNSKQIVQDMNGDAPPIGLSSLSTTQTQATKPGSAVGYWKFDEGYGTTANNAGICGSTCNGTLTSMATSPSTTTSGWANSGKVGKALVFDATNDYVSVGNPAPAQITGPLSLSAWVKLNANNVLYGVISKEGSSGQFSYELVVTSSGKASFDVSGTGSAKIAINGNTTLATGTWYHLTGVYIPGVSITVYVNGVQDGQNTTSIPSSIFNGTGNVQIGAFNTSGFINGYIDEAKIYPFSLSQSDIIQDYNQGKAQVFGASSTASDGVTASAGQDREYCVPGDTSTCNPPVAEYKMDERTGTTANDTSGNGYSGALTNSPAWSFGKYGSGVNFNGTNQDIIINPNNGLSATTGTISAWVYPTVAAPAVKEMIVQGNRETSRIYLLRLNTSGNLGLSLGSTSSVDSGVNIPINTWSYVSMTWNSGTYVMYFNGRQVATGAYSGMGALDGFSIIGSYSDLAAPDSYFTGNIDQVRMYNYARTPAQMAWEYQKNIPNIGYYKFDECTGATANDASGSGNNGTITIGASGTQASAGTCTTASTAWGNGVTGKYSSSLNFDGTDDYVDLGDLPSTEGASQLSWEAWVKPSSLAINKVIIAKGNGLAATQASWGLSTDSATSSSLRVSVSTTTSDVSTYAVVPNVFTNGTWTHIVAVFDGTASGNSNRLKVYVNGSITIPTYSGTIPTSTQATTSNVRIGSASDAAAFFTGQIDNVKIFSYPLTAVQVKTAYNEGSALRFGP